MYLALHEESDEVADHSTIIGRLLQLLPGRSGRCGLVGRSRAGRWECSADGGVVG